MSEKFQNIKAEIILYIKNNKTQSIKAAILVILFIIAACLFFAGGSEDDSDAIIVDDSGQETVSQEVQPEALSDIYVDVGGAVNMPGVVSLPAGSRVFEAISAVGGVSRDGDTSTLNLASILSDGDKIYISRIGEITDTSQSQGSFSSSTKSNAKPDKINLNRATSEQLQLLNGVGPAMAERIIEYRNSAGMFKTTKELMNVSGIGEKTFTKLEPNIEI